jgi:hypothetical protein
MVIGARMPNILIQFIKNVNGESVVIRTELCENEFEADHIVEQEEGHYDLVKMIDLRDNKNAIK